MNKRFIILALLVVFANYSFSKESRNLVEWKYKGQVSAYSHYNGSNVSPLLLGGRYLPQINLEFNSKESKLFDLEASANIYGNTAIKDFGIDSNDGNLKPYRVWLRYSTAQLEIRAGLQKINFGSASMLRPLMWFDQIDPRDPLKLTDGVWGVLGRYYFLNNTNIWFWGLYGNKNPKGWEQLKSNTEIPEFGGRLQVPIPSGEMAFSYHHRYADSREFPQLPPLDKIEENRFGFDIRYDWLIGCWLEASWIKKEANLGVFNNQEVINLGMDYTLGIGSGIYLAFEQLLLAYNEKAFAWKDPVTFSLLSASYPLGLFDNLSAIVYYDWYNNNAYNFVNYQHQFRSMSLFLIAYLNPENYNIPAQGGSTNLFGGKGVQVMLVWNH